MGGKRRSSVRMKDIAEDLGVSVVTVSKVLRNHSDISEETRQRVLKRIEELHYRPNLAARSLVTGRSYIIGLVVPDLVHPFFGQVAKGMSRALRTRGYSVVISSSEEDAALEQREIEHLLARSVDALIVASTQPSAESFRNIDARNTPYILIDRRLPDLETNFVGVDDEEVGRIATEHLIEIGCRRIAHIRGPEVSTAAGRLKGYRQTLERHGFNVSPDAIVRCDSFDDAADISGHRAMQMLLQHSPLPDAVFCYNDPTALGAMMAILDAGLRVPQDIAIVGCGNVLHSEFLRVPLTTVDQSSSAIGEKAAKLALGLIESRAPVQPREILLPPKLIERESTARRRGA